MVVDCRDLGILEVPKRDNNNKHCSGGGMFKAWDYN